MLTSQATQTKLWNLAEVGSCGSNLPNFPSIVARQPSEDQAIVLEGHIRFTLPRKLLQNTPLVGLTHFKL